MGRTDHFQIVPLAFFQTSAVRVQLSIIIWPWISSQKTSELVMNADTWLFELTIHYDSPYFFLRRQSFNEDELRTLEVVEGIGFGVILLIFLSSETSVIFVWFLMTDRQERNDQSVGEKLSREFAQCGRIVRLKHTRDTRDDRSKCLCVLQLLAIQGAEVAKHFRSTEWFNTLKNRLTAAADHITALAK
jgi:hypothetical protein